MINKKTMAISIILSLVLMLCGCNFNNEHMDDVAGNGTAANTDVISTDKNTNTLPNTIDTYAKNYTEVGEVFPTKSVVIGDESQTEVEAEESTKEGMSTYTSDFGYSIEYPETYTPQRNFDGKEFIILDKESGSNMNVIITYPNIIYESEEKYSQAIEGNDDIRLKKFEVTEINGINAVQMELAIVGGYAYQTIYRTGEYYYILSYVQGKGVTRTFDADMKAIINSLKLN